MKFITSFYHTIFVIAVNNKDHGLRVLEIVPSHKIAKLELVEDGSIQTNHQDRHLLLAHFFNFVLLQKVTKHASQEVAALLLKPELALCPLQQLLELRMAQVPDCVSGLLQWFIINMYLGPSEDPKGRMPRKPNPVWDVHTNVIRLDTTPGQQGSGIVTANYCHGCERISPLAKEELIREHFSAAYSVPLRESSMSQDALQDVSLGNLGDSHVDAGMSSGQQTSQPSSGGTSRKRARVQSQDEEGSGDDQSTAPTAAPRHTTLPSRVHSQSWVKERQKVAEMEIACTLVECNIAFNVLRTDQWKRMVRAIAQVGPTDLLRVTDMEGSTLGLVYHLFMQMRGHIQSCRTLSLGRRDDILAIVDSRWEFMRRPIHGMAAILHPFYKTPELFGDIPLLTLRSEYLNLMLSEDDQLVIDGEMSSFMNNLGPTYLRSVATRSEATRSCDNRCNFSPVLVLKFYIVSANGMPGQALELLCYQNFARTGVHLLNTGDNPRDYIL
ncbi:hypothetical protein L7F22_031122 [Adiantum nelumboides]|nr:hypothetical protein [Adiantum nelumboides]